MSHLLNLHFLSLLTTAAARSGSDLRAVLASLELGIHTDEGKAPILPLSVLVALFEQLEARATTGRFLFAYTDIYNFDTIPALSAFLASAQSLRQLKPVLDWVPVLVHPDLVFEINDHGDAMSLRPRVTANDPRLVDHPLLIEMMMAIVMRMGHQIADSRGYITQIRFKHRPLCNPSAYEAYFQCRIDFQASDNAMVADSHLLDGALPGSLPLAHSRAEASIRQYVLGDGIAPPLVMQAEMQLRQHRALLGEGLDGLAHALHIQPRTLQRALKKAGSSYSQLLAQVRKDMATAMLRDSDLDIDSIALKLGFNERRSFTLAFRQWQGITPTAYRIKFTQ